MRTGFGRFAMELRAARGMSLSQFSEKAGLSPQRVCNIEFGRAPVTDDVVGVYIRELDLRGEEAHELRTRAVFANGLKRSSEEGHQYPPLRALFETLSDQLSPKAATEIQRILERESGLSIKSLAFASNKMSSRGARVRKPGLRPLPSPKRFVDICLLAEEKHNLVAGEMSPVKIGPALEKLCSLDETLDYQVVDEMPSYMAGAFACILGDRNGHIITVEAKRLASAENGVYFARHVIGHELAHHYLHPELLISESVAFLPPQPLARNTPELMNTEKQIEQVVDSLVEAEAELFSTMFLVPWTSYIKGTGLTYLSSDYGEQIEEVKRYAPHFKNPAVVDAFKGALWARGVRRHPVFSLN